MLPFSVPNYHVMNFNTSFNVNKISTNVSVNVDTNYGEIAVVNGTVSNVVDGEVTLFINDTKNITICVKDGKFSTTIPNLMVGDYNISVVYNGDNNHASSNTTANLTIHNHKSSFNIKLN